MQLNTIYNYKELVSYNDVRPNWRNPEPIIITGEIVGIYCTVACDTVEVLYNVLDQAGNTYWITEKRLEASKIPLTKVVGD